MSRREIYPEASQKKVKYYLAFALRCVHSLAGIAFTLFLCEHLFTNMLASSYFSEGKGFIAMVNSFHRVPGLKIIEVVCLALPFLCHVIIGTVYLFQGKSNCYVNEGNRPYLPYAKNYAYTWQRWTAWILLFGIAFHVAHLRFVRYPLHVHIEGTSYYAVAIQPSRYNAIVKGTKDFLVMNVPPGASMIEVPHAVLDDVDMQLFSENSFYLLTPSAGTAFLYVVRDALGSLAVALLYTILVIAAAFHGFNGLWTFCSRWGIVISLKLQALVRVLCYLAMVVVSAMGLSVIWNLYNVA
ncbi:Succinate dehydrogenase/fumarate reductase, cytochrome b subunit,succinate dehydrogenase (or fumarate reductase) cytochrome b subunit, b558 family,Succinate dehydrogenase/Fumarate reductase transmembrane subunit [Chlamydia serpentis]|uniref:Succinate dehydrogenase/fumarate reductase, cytochrome b subunit,succinate dehydrogenase (Or fumarate reductase) cytochrome b subunit, b558 family,Succinate dehydrogenase/Fumarate reductase transme... n=1 Tax=Chlamydia serpentis TaxID=1967782 RepID=A0A2R8FC47_9CHLA|nr:succinate dehydrogenase cytochrome b558 subunit [Chlamydia serpentis]SPN73902.1 Succinate dehydrogenase/fumarate reductase, cytochrome b subunit,succinate dehydrogenase (or fumarate reductase) cytochrome b subunit, b558 family,Succinate dehydrogenase/Fumarate reductase transmembrane subunit [Chlamydia serpentis]